MEGCTIVQAAYLNGVPLVDYNTFEKKAVCDCARIAARMVKL